MSISKKKAYACQEEMDRVRHSLVEQIARISVNEEEERMKAELDLLKEDNTEE